MICLIPEDNLWVDIERVEYRNCWSIDVASESYVGTDVSHGDCIVLIHRSDHGSLKKRPSGADF